MAQLTIAIVRPVLGVVRDVKRAPPEVSVRPVKP